MNLLGLSNAVSVQMALNKLNNRLIEPTGRLEVGKKTCNHQKQRHLWMVSCDVKYEWFVEIGLKYAKLSFLFVSFLFMFFGILEEQIFTFFCHSLLELQPGGLQHLVLQCFRYWNILATYQKGLKDSCSVYDGVSGLLACGFKDPRWTNGRWRMTWPGSAVWNHSQVTCVSVHPPHLEVLGDGVDSTQWCNRPVKGHLASPDAGFHLSLEAQLW